MLTILTAEPCVLPKLLNGLRTKTHLGRNIDAPEKIHCLRQNYLSH